MVPVTSNGHDVTMSQKQDRNLEESNRVAGAAYHGEASTKHRATCIIEQNLILLFYQYEIYGNVTRFPRTSFQT